MPHGNKNSICCDIHGAGYLQEAVLCPNLLINKVVFQQNYWRLTRAVLLAAPEGFSGGSARPAGVFTGQVGGPVRQGTNDRLLQNSHISETTMSSESAYCC